MFNNDNNVTRILTEWGINNDRFFANDLNSKTVKLVTPTNVKKFDSLDDLIKFLTELGINEDDIEDDTREESEDLSADKYSLSDNLNEDLKNHKYHLSIDDLEDVLDGMYNHLRNTLIIRLKHTSKEITKKTKKKINKNYHNEKRFIINAVKHLEEYIHNERIEMEENIKNEIKTLMREMMEQNNHTCNCHSDNNESILNNEDADKVLKDSKKETKSKGKTKTPKHE